MESQSLEPLFRHVALSADVFFSGVLCRRAEYGGDPTRGQLHLLRSGKLELTDDSGRSRCYDEPTLLFYPRGGRHRMIGSSRTRPGLLCATIEFGGSANLLIDALPDLVELPLERISTLQGTMTLLFAESDGQEPGRGPAINRLFEYFTILLLRFVVAERLIDGHFMAGVTDARLRKLINAVHEKPEHPWTLASMAALANMSRARFADHFRQVVGRTPLDYLTDWRMSVARSLLLRGRPVPWVAPAVGYSSPSAFARVFAERVGCSPAKWPAEAPRREAITHPAPAPGPDSPRGRATGRIGRRR